MPKRYHYYNDNDPYCFEWLQSLIRARLIPPGLVDPRPIQLVQPSDLIEFVQCHFFAGIAGWPLALKLAQWPIDRPIWTGSCPCQPFSVAGKRQGVTDERHLWPHLFRLIRACRPQFVMGEQVAGAAGYAWFDGVGSDLEGEGYACRAVDIPTCAVGAPHRRSRIYWIAEHRANEGAGVSSQFGRLRIPEPMEMEAEQQGVRLPQYPLRQDSHASPDSSISARSMDGPHQWEQVGQSTREFTDGYGIGEQSQPPGQRSIQAQEPRLLGGADPGGEATSSNRTIQDRSRGSSCLPSREGETCPARKSALWVADRTLIAQREPQYEVSAEPWGRSRLDAGGTGARSGGLADCHDTKRRPSQPGGHEHNGGSPGREQGDGDAQGCGRGIGGMEQSAESRCGTGERGTLAAIRNEARSSEPERRSGSNSGPWNSWELIGPDPQGKYRRAKPGVLLLAHGVPSRVAKLRALGNSIVPQLAAEVIRAWMECEQEQEGV